MAHIHRDVPAPIGAGVEQPEGQDHSHEDFRNRTTFEWKPLSIPEEYRTRIPDNESKAQNRETYASFGNGGTTASVNAYGHIMQISRYLKHDRSGFFCVDLFNTPEPYLVTDRMQYLMEVAKDCEKGIRLDSEKRPEYSWGSQTARPSLEFVHDRWPRFTSRKEIEPENRTLVEFDSVQYFCNEGIIFQKYTWKCGSKDEEIPEVYQFRFRSDLRIRDLDFVDGSNSFNNSYNDYSCETISDDHSLLILHKIPLKSIEETGETDGPNSSKARGEPTIGLIITPFAYDEVQEIHPDNDDIHVITLSPEAIARFQREKVLEITMTYKLERGNATKRWEQAMVTAYDLKKMETTLSNCTDDTYRPIRFSTHHHLDFIIRRNLEHILSVCSIPVSPKNSNGHEDMAVALTCGDISGHRVALHASFFAFQFLLSIFRYIDNEKSTKQYLPHEQSCKCEERKDRCGPCQELQPYLQQLRDRIRKTCRGHMKWVCEQTEPTDQGQFAPHYWASGDAIPPSEYLPPASLVDSPLQILKVSNFFSQFMSRPDGISSFGELFRWSETIAYRKLRTKIRPWIKELDTINMRGKYVFSRTSEGGGNPKYSLADHVWICRAIRSVEVLGLSHEMRQDDEEAENRILNNYSFDDFRDTVFKRFTTENPFTKERMLATRRSSSKTRFLFHSKDTSLLHAIEYDLLDDQKKMKSRGTEKHMYHKSNRKYTLDLWRNTVDAQLYHDEYQNLNWTKPLWYALVLAMSAKEKQVCRISAEKAFAFSCNILFRSSSPNGLFPGLYDAYQEPTIQLQEARERDDYWHTTFEIPYILWEHGKKWLEADAGPEKEHAPTDVTSVSDTAHVNNGVRFGQIATKSLPFTPFGHLISPNIFVEISDDWLQPHSHSLGFDFTPNFPDFPWPTASLTQPNFDEVPETPMLENGIEAATDKEGKCTFSDQIGKKGTVIDIPQRSKGIEFSCSQLSNEEILNTLKKTRTVQKAKKRLVWLQDGDKETALACLYASPDPEKDNIFDFFRRHASHGKYFFERTTPEHNEWETEIHLSFFRLLNENQIDIRQTARKIPIVSFVSLRERENFKARSNSLIHRNYEEKGTIFSQATMSFRFVGDFSDHYWTCHFLEHNDDRVYLNLERRFSSLPHITGSPYYPKQKQKRPVLHLLLFGQILQEIESNTAEILAWVKKKILRSSAAETIAEEKRYSGLSVSRFHRDISIVEASKPFNSLAEALRIQLLQHEPSEDFLSVIERWRLFEKILQAIENDLKENLEVISQWSHRNDQNYLEKPRWTRADEKRYRPVITKLTLFNERKIRNLDRLKTEMQTFRVSITRRLESMKDDIDFHGSENINLFTYVTVVFLPLGFATGVFSMSTAPDSKTLMNMVQLAVFALVITAFALVNARTCRGVIGKPIVMICRLFGDLVLRPIGFIADLLLHLIGLVGNPLLHPIGSVGHFIFLSIRFVGKQFLELIEYNFYRYIKYPVADLLGRKDFKYSWDRRWDLQGRIRQLEEYLSYGSDLAEEARKDYEETGKKKEKEKGGTSNLSDSERTDRPSPDQRTESESDANDVIERDHRRGTYHREEQADFMV